MKLFVETFGCQMNTADSLEMADAFLKKGVQLTFQEIQRRRPHLKYLHGAGPRRTQGPVLPGTA